MRDLGLNQKGNEDNELAAAMKVINRAAIRQHRKSQSDRERIYELLDDIDFCIPDCFNFDEHGKLQSITCADPFDD